MEPHPGIRIDKIPISGAAGLLFVLGTLVNFLIGLPAARGFLLISLPAGVVGDIGLYLWRQQTRW